MNIIKACKGGAQVRDINQQMHRSMALSFILAQEDPMRHQFFFLISKARYINEEAESYKYTGGIQSNNPLSKQKNQQGPPPLSWTPTIPRTL